MEYSVQYSRAAEKYLDSQPMSVQVRIMDAVDRLPQGDVIKLKGREGYRLTVGGFRVLFDYSKGTARDGNVVIDVVAIGPRGDVYKK